MLDLICHNRPCRPGKPRQHCGVITGPGPHLEDLLPLLHIERRKINCVKNGLPVVDSPFRCKTHDDVLVVIAPGKYFPRSGT